MPSRRRVLLLLTLVAGLGGAGAAYTRSAVPLALDGTVTKIDVRSEKHPGIDDVYLVTIGERTVHLDAAVGKRLRRGDAVSKEAWDTTLVTKRGNIPLGRSSDVAGLVVASVVAMVAVKLIT